MTLKVPKRVQINELDVLISNHTKSCGPMSASHQMRKLPTYAAIINAGELAIPLIIDRLRKGQGSTSLYVLLRGITGECPYTPEQIKGTAFAKWDNSAEEKAWIEWAEAKGF